ncbi:hypothetical protein Tco_1088055 [Tanacetum coccineum]
MVSELDNLKERNIALEEKRNTLGQVATLESATATKDVELASLHSQIAKLTQGLSSLQLSCDELSIRVASLESQRDVFKVLSDRVAGLDSELMALALHLDEEFYPRFLTTIYGRRWILCHDGLLAGIDHGKAERDLTDVAAYDPSVEASITDIMSLLRLEGLFAETLEVSRLQPSYEQLLLPVYWKEDNVVTGETSLSDYLDVVHARVQKLKEGVLSRHLSISDAMGVLADPLSSESLIGEASTSGVPVTAVTTTALAISIIAANISSIPPISVADYDIPGAGFQDTAPHSPKIVFEKEDL